MVNYFDVNFSVLKRWHPDLAERVRCTVLADTFDAEVSKNGKMTVRINGVYLHSKYDPQQEASRWADCAIEGLPPSARVTVMGCGLGYHLVELVRRGFTAVAIEPSLQLFKLALAFVDLSDVIPYCEFLIGLPEDLVRRRHRETLRAPVRVFPNCQRVFPDYINGLASFASALPGVASGGFRIMVVNPIYGGSLPIAVHAADALRALGNEVVSFESEYFAKAMTFSEKFRFEGHGKEIHRAIASMLSQAVLLKAAEFQPDFVVALAQAPLLPDALGQLKRCGIPVAFWFVEDFKVFDYWSAMAPFYSCLFTIQKGEFLDKLRGMGVRAEYLPNAASPAFHRPMKLGFDEENKFGSDLSFLGAGYYNRQRFFPGLSDLDFKIWGSDWPAASPLRPLVQNGGQRIDSETSVAIFNAARINLNLHSSTCCEGVDPNGDFVNPRTFEIASCGAFQLVDGRSLLADLFAADEMATFEDLNDLRGKIKLFLGDRSGRKAYADRARRRVLGEHTYEMRMEEMVALITAAFPEVVQKRDMRLSKMSDLLARAQSQQGLSDLLASDGGSVELKDIYERIDARRGKLTRAEKIFQVLRNIPVVHGAAQ